MKKNRSLMRLIADAADLPGEILPGVPLIELCGNRRILIENHKGILEYGEDRIMVGIQGGALTILGRSMQIDRMERRTLVLTGTVFGVEFAEEDFK